MKRLYSITIHGKHKTWSYLVWARPEHVADWREDGIVDLEFYQQFDDVEKIKCLNKMLTRDRVSKHFDTNL